jgi:hypothetical protein
MLRIHQIELIPASNADAPVSDNRSGFGRLSRSIDRKAAMRFVGRSKIGNALLGRLWNFC